MTKPIFPANIMARKPAGFEPFMFDEHSGVYTFRRFKYNPQDPMNSTADYWKTQDVEEVLDSNKHDTYNAKGTFTQKGRLGVKAASIPMMVQLKWLVEDGIDMTKAGHCEWTDKKLKNKLNSMEYQHLRVAQFQL